MERRAAAVACSSSSSGSSVRQAASGKINAQRGTAGRGELRSTTTLYDDVGRGEICSTKLTTKVHDDAGRGEL